MDKKITYRIATEKDYPAILILYNKMYRSERSLEDFEWLVADNPAGKAILFIAAIDNDVVGMQSLIPYHFRRNNEIIKTYKSEDSLVNEKLRGRGIYSKLYAMVHQYVEGTLVWGLTDKKAILENVNMPSSERLTIVVSVKNPLFSFNNISIQKYVAKTIFYSFLYFKSAFNSGEFKRDLSLQKIAMSDYGNDNLQNFFSKISSENPNLLYPVMDEKYLNWRFTNNPNLESYQMYCSFDEEGEISVCSIIGIKEKSAYWQSVYKSKSVSEQAFLSHLNTVRINILLSGVNIIHSWLFECNKEIQEISESFYKAGFSKVREGLWIVHNSNEKAINVHDLYFSPQLGIR